MKKMILAHLGIKTHEIENQKMSPRMAWRAIQAGLPEDAIISSDIGNNCAIGNVYPTFENGRKYLHLVYLDHVVMAFHL